MINHPRIIRQSAHRLAEAADRTTRSYRDSRVQQEPAFADRMLGRIEEAMDGFEIKGVRWSAMTLTDRGRNSQESIYGADFLGVLDIDIPSFKVKKGFLAQAKRFESNTSIGKDDFDEMITQCEKMLETSPASFVFLYATDGIKIVPAISVVGLPRKTNPHVLYSRSTQRFFEEHFECFIGDRDLHTPSIQTLEDLKQIADEASARDALSLKARSTIRKA